MRYTETLLADGERILLRRRQHWLALLVEARLGVFLIVAGVVLLGLVAWLKLPSGQLVYNVVSGAALVCLVAGLLFILYRAWHWSAQDYVVTNRRLLKVEGIFNKRSADSSLEKINDAILAQGLLGRLLNYGDLNILTAADEQVDDYHMLNGPKEFKIAMLNAKNALATDFDTRRPSPPMRAQPAEAAPPLPPADEQPAPETTDVPASAAGEPDSAAEITRTLARLADLRDRGALSAEEYEAKKTELLGRL
jgi:uncharacterized membrane protein YdbT with pleckstrin-like domain